MGIDPRRITFSWVSASEGAKWRDVVNETVAKARALGPFTAYRELNDRNVSADHFDRARTPLGRRQLGRRGGR